MINQHNREKLKLLKLVRSETARGGLLPRNPLSSLSPMSTKTDLDLEFSIGDVSLANGIEEAAEKWGDEDFVGAGGRKKWVGL